LTLFLESFRIDVSIKLNDLEVKMKLLLQNTKGNKIALEVEGMKSYPSENGEWGWIEYDTNEGTIFWTVENGFGMVHPFHYMPVEINAIKYDVVALDVDGKYV